MILVEFEPEGQWLAVSRTLTALVLAKGLRVLYGTAAQPRDEVLNSLMNLGVEVELNEKAGRLRIDDYHNSTLSLDRDNPGFVAVEDRYLRVGSAKIADWSIDQLRGLRNLDGGIHLSKWGPEQQDVLSIVDSFSPLLRFNDERTFLEWIETRELPLNRKLGRINFIGISQRIHSEPFYARLEGAVDGLIEVQARELNGEVKNMLRIRNLKGQPHDSRWHEIKVGSSGETSLVT
jgi:KaiC/GvpD/RAD55 family RecA-like ATPase